MRWWVRQPSLQPIDDVVIDKTDFANRNNGVVVTMITAIAIDNYRSISSLVMEVGQLNVITGTNGSGKSNLYRALRLLGKSTDAGLGASLALDGGLPSVMFAGPEDVSGRMRRGEVPVQGGSKSKQSSRLRLGFSSSEGSYAVSVGILGGLSPFSLDPEFKRESIWAGAPTGTGNLLLERTGNLIRRRSPDGWEVVTDGIPRHESLFSFVGKSSLYPEVNGIREVMRDWRFYDHFRTDPDSPLRQPQMGSRTPVLASDGRDLAAAIATITEIGDSEALAKTIDDAFPGCTVEVERSEKQIFLLRLRQPGLLRSLSSAELSDGTLRYLLLTAALLTPRPPTLMVLNEPEASLHPDLIVPLAKLIGYASQKSQIWVVTHSTRLSAALEYDHACNTIRLEKTLSKTEIVGQGRLDRPAWKWPD